MPLPRSRLTASAAAVFVFTGLAAGHAFAAPAAPEPGTDACTALVEADATVRGALATLTGLPATAALLDREAAQDRLDEVRVAAALRLCTGDEDVDEDPGTGAPDPTTTTPAPPTSSTPDDDEDGPRDERDCTDFATRQDAQDFYDAVGTPANPDPSRLDRDGDGIACEVTEGVSGSGSGSGSESGSIDLDPTDDDDSVADIDGSQVSVVPEGSAATGA